MGDGGWGMGDGGWRSGGSAVPVLFRPARGPEAVRAGRFRSRQGVSSPRRGEAGRPKGRGGTRADRPAPAEGGAIFRSSLRWSRTPGTLAAPPWRPRGGVGTFPLPASRASRFPLPASRFPLPPVSLLSDFKTFALRGNLVDLAIGFTVGAAFTTVAQSLVDDLLMPPLGLVLGQTDFSDYYLLLRAGEAAPPPYETIEAARAAGAVTLGYGSFLTNVFTFVVVAVVVFVLVRAVKRAGEAVEDEFGEPDEPDTPDTKKCAYCRQNVPYQASRCPECTSFLGTHGGPLTPDAGVMPKGAPAGGAA